MAKHKSDDDFFEVVPGAYIDEFRGDEFTDDETKAERDARFTAIVTIVLTIFVAIAMGVLFLKGVDTIKSSVQQPGVIVP